LEALGSTVLSACAWFGWCASCRGLERAKALPGTTLQSSSVSGLVSPGGGSEGRPCWSDMSDGPTVSVERPGACRTSALQPNQTVSLVSHGCETERTTGVRADRAVPHLDALVGSKRHGARPQARNTCMFRHAHTTFARHLSPAVLQRQDSCPLLFSSRCMHAACVLVE
jgi:hypothetical protein